MVVRVAYQAMKSHATRTVVVADGSEIFEVCERSGVSAVITKPEHISGTDRLAEACALLNLSEDDIVVNVQGDEPLIDPNLINAVAKALEDRPDCAMSTAAHAIDETIDYLNPNVVKVVTDSRQSALYFSRSPIPAFRDVLQTGGCKSNKSSDPPLRHVGIYAYRAKFLRIFPTLSPAPLELQESLEQLRALWHGYSIAVHITKKKPGRGVDTPEDLESVRQMVSRSTDSH